MLKQTRSQRFTAMPYLDHDVLNDEGNMGAKATNQDRKQREKAIVGQYTEDVCVGQNQGPMHDLDPVSTESTNNTRAYHALLLNGVCALDSGDELSLELAVWLVLG
jgi:hypothetical protein